MAIASSFAASDPGGATWTIATTSPAEFAAATYIPMSGILSITTATAMEFSESAPTLSLSILFFLDTSATQQKILGSIDNLDDALVLLSANVSRIFEIVTSAKNSNFKPIFGNPFVVLSTTALVTAFDTMVPFVPCQPLTISLGVRYGVWAFLVCVVGQTLAGVLVFQLSRKVSDAKKVQRVLESLGDNGQLRFQKFKTKSLLGGGDTGGASEKERTVFFALGLRLAPFFPFSAGNYLLGGATDVGLRPFVLATILGCTFSNAVSVLLGMGGAELLMNTASN